MLSKPEVSMSFKFSRVPQKCNLQACKHASRQSYRSGRKDGPGIAPKGQTVSSRGCNPRKRGKKPNRPLRGRTTGQPRWGWRNSHCNVIRRLKPAATHGRPLRGLLFLGYTTQLDFDGILPARMAKQQLTPKGWTWTSERGLGFSDQ